MHCAAGCSTILNNRCDEHLLPVTHNLNAIKSYLALIIIIIIIYCLWNLNIYK